MDTITLIWQLQDDGFPPLPELYREKIILPYGSLEEAKVAWERICEAALEAKRKVK